MKKMAKREIIILCVMSIIVLYGLGSFIFGGSGKKTAPSSVLNPAELKSLTSEIATAMSEDVLSPGQAYAIARADAEWLRNPFYEKKAYGEMLKYKETAKSGADAGKKITFNYTGYMEAGGKKIAIINGAEYYAGEVLEEQGYILRAIFPDKVVIENKSEMIKSEVPIRD